MCVYVKSWSWQNQKSFIWQKMSDVLDNVTRWHCAEWWHYTAATRTRSPENPSVIKFCLIRVRHRTGRAELSRAGMWRDVSRLCKEIWQMTSIHHNPALSPAPAPPPTPASSTVTGWPQIMTLWLQTQDTAPEILTTRDRSSTLWHLLCRIRSWPPLMGKGQKAINPELSWYQTCDRSSGDHYNIIRIPSITHSQYTLHSTHQPAWHNTNNDHTLRI